jgi:hypothetical protein
MFQHFIALHQKDGKDVLDDAGFGLTEMEAIFNLIGKTNDTGELNSIHPSIAVHSLKGSYRLSSLDITADGTGLSYPAGFHLCHAGMCDGVILNSYDGEENAKLFDRDPTHEVGVTLRLGYQPAHIIQCDNCGETVDFTKEELWER